MALLSMSMNIINIVNVNKSKIYDRYTMEVNSHSYSNMT